jgi:hypothetical protein
MMGIGITMPRHEGNVFAIRSTCGGDCPYINDPRDGSVRKKFRKNAGIKHDVEECVQYEGLSRYSGQEALQGPAPRYPWIPSSG